MAIIDDIGAVLVISLFYTEHIALNALAGAAAALIALLVLNQSGVRHPLWYLMGGVVLWWFIYQSGVHATTAGILAAVMVPARPYAQTRWFSRRMPGLLQRFEKLDEPDTSILETQRQHQVLEEVKQVALQTTTPVQHWGSVLDKPVSLLILPLFAFLNAGVVLPTSTSALTHAPVMWATGLALVIGKGLGISLFAWLFVRLGWAKLPDDMHFGHITGLGLLAGMGFTMSLFIATLAFGDSSDLLLQAKLGIMGGSLVAGVTGVIVLLLSGGKKRHG